MKALTVCQPFAHLICLPDDDDRAKRVENRTWNTLYRGPLLIHAGKSREWLNLDETGVTDEAYSIPVSEMAFGAIIGVAKLAGCFHVEVVQTAERNSKGVLAARFRKQIPETAIRRWPWLPAHANVKGPFCWVLTECRRFLKPIPYRGAQRLFHVPDQVVAEQLAAVGW